MHGMILLMYMHGMYMHILVCHGTCYIRVCTVSPNHVHVVRIPDATQRLGPQQLRSGRGLKRSTGPAVLAGRPQGDDSESPMA